MPHVMTSPNTASTKVSNRRTQLQVIMHAAGIVRVRYASTQHEFRCHCVQRTSMQSRPASAAKQHGCGVSNMVAMTKKHSIKSQRGFCGKEKRLCLPGTYCVRSANRCNAAGIVNGTAMCSPVYTQPCSAPDRQTASCSAQKGGNVAGGAYGVHRREQGGR
jgi:hypothetical protein